MPIWKTIDNSIEGGIPNPFDETIDNVLPVRMSYSVNGLVKPLVVLYPNPLDPKVLKIEVGTFKNTGEYDVNFSKNDGSQSVNKTLLITGVKHESDNNNNNCGNSCGGCGTSNSCCEASRETTNTIHEISTTVREHNNNIQVINKEVYATKEQLCELGTIVDKIDIEIDSLGNLPIIVRQDHEKLGNLDSLLESEIKIRKSEDRALSNGLIETNDIAIKALNKAKMLDDFKDELDEFALELEILGTIKNKIAILQNDYDALNEAMPNLNLLDIRLKKLLVEVDSKDDIIKNLILDQRNQNTAFKKLLTDNLSEIIELTEKANAIDRLKTDLNNFEIEVGNEFNEINKTLERLKNRICELDFSDDIEDLLKKYHQLDLALEDVENRLTALEDDVCGLKQDVIELKKKVEVNSALISKLKAAGIDSLTNDQLIKWVNHVKTL